MTAAVKILTIGQWDFMQKPVIKITGVCILISLITFLLYD
jgi:hypothetical protein